MRSAVVDTVDGMTPDQVTDALYQAAMAQGAPPASMICIGHIYRGFNKAIEAAQTMGIPPDEFEGHLISTIATMLHDMYMLKTPAKDRSLIGATITATHNAKWLHNLMLGIIKESRDRGAL